MFDLLFVAVVGLSTAFAVLRGGLREFSTLLALAIAGGATLLFIDPALAVTRQAGSFFGTAFVAAVLIAVFFLGAHIGLHLGLKRIPLKGRAVLIDRISGGAFGFFRGLVLIGLGYLGYTYYLDEAKQPDEIKTAMTRPVAAGMANWFESFTPETSDLDAPVRTSPEDDVDAAVSGYERSDRNGLNEIVTTVTTTDPTIAATSPDARDQAETEEEDELDPIADIIEEESPQ